MSGEEEFPGNKIGVEGVTSKRVEADFTSASAWVLNRVHWERGDVRNTAENKFQTSGFRLLCWTPYQLLPPLSAPRFPANLKWNWSGSGTCLSRWRAHTHTQPYSAFLFPRLEGRKRSLEDWGTKPADLSLEAWFVSLRIVVRRIDTHLRAEWRSL